MRKLALLLLLAGIIWPLWAEKAVSVEKVTVGQLDQVLADARSRKDADVAKELARLELTERATTARLLLWEAGLPGPKSRQALIALADASGFLDPPAAEIPDISAPDVAAQRQIMARAVDYLGKILPRLPNFFATRTTTRFVDVLPGVEEDWKVSSRYEPLHFLDRSSATVLFRDGKEVVDTGAAKDKKLSPIGQGLTTRGVFGPILGIVIVDAARGNVSWSHWEQGASGPRAVFHYAVPQEKSHYQVGWCCTTFKKVGNEFYLREVEQLTGYHGEIAIDPENGTILRLTLEADLKPDDPISRAAILVEYGPVEIGGKTYTCPVKSVSLSLAPVVIALRDPSAKANVPEIRKTSLNDVEFGQYHLFRAETRILGADSPEQDGNVPAAAPATTPAASPQR